MGVTALYASTVSGLRGLIPNLSFLVFDNGFGRRRTTTRLGEDADFEVDFCGAHAGMRIDRAENLLSMATASSLGGLGAFVNTYVRAIDTCDAVLDISGGDSFSDIYGMKRFKSVVRPKLIALRRKVPLILLPQTYGPYRTTGAREAARKAVKGATMCWARDKPSFGELRNLLGDAFNSESHFCGVDLAFGLGPKDASDQVGSEILTMINTDRSVRPLVGFNVSGLIYNDPDAAVSNYGFKSDYRKLVLSFLEWLMKNTKANLVLVPHVMSPKGHYESDPGACESIARDLPEEFGSRIAVSPASFDQSQVKWLISQANWFCGTRMHSTIAALSSGVPTATISYSDKALGVFQSCGQGEQVFDPRRLSGDQILNELLHSYESRATIQNSLNEHLPNVQAQLSDQLHSIASVIQRLGDNQ